MSEREQQLSDLAKLCAQRLLGSQQKLVFAESCTSGLLAATISQNPGISAHFCGSFVTYRESLKIDALGVDPNTLEQHTAVSEQTSGEMLAGAFDRCSESSIGIAITGHLGPNAPGNLDGLVFIAGGFADGSRSVQKRVELQAQNRQQRQYEAAIAAFMQLQSLLSETSADI